MVINNFEVGSRMIYVSIHGQVQKRGQVREFCQNVLNDLMPRLRRDVDINIQFVKNCDDQEAGYCVGDRDMVDITIAKSSQNESYTIDEQLITLCHELVHAKQFLKGELENSMVWKGVDLSFLPLAQHPWEIEAFEQEQPLYEKHKHIVLH
jgi:hypothetical protein